VSSVVGVVVGVVVSVSVGRPSGHVEIAAGQPRNRDHGTVGETGGQLGMPITGTVAAAALRHDAVNGHPKLATFHSHPVPLLARYRRTSVVVTQFVHFRPDLGFAGGGHVAHRVVRRPDVTESPVLEHVRIGHR